MKILRTTLNDIKDLGGDPFADNCFMGQPIHELDKLELLGVIDLLLKQQESARERFRSYVAFQSDIDNPLAQTRNQA